MKTRTIGWYVFTTVTLCALSFWQGVEQQQYRSSSSSSSVVVVGGGGHSESSNNHQQPQPFNNVLPDPSIVVAASSSSAPLLLLSTPVVGREPQRVEDQTRSGEDGVSMSVPPQRSSLENLASANQPVRRTRFTQERWTQFVETCESVVREADRRPRVPPSYADSGGAYSSDIVCYHQAVVLQRSEQNSIYDTHFPFRDDLYFQEHIDEVVDEYWNASWGLPSRRNHPSEDHLGGDGDRDDEEEDEGLRGGRGGHRTSEPHPDAYRSNDSRLLVLHHPHVTALALSASYLSLNYYHLLMDGLIPAAEWLLRAQPHDAPLSGANLVEVVIVGNKKQLDDFRKPRITSSFPFAALLSTDRRTVILAEGTDQRAHCYCQHVNFATNNLPKFGTRRQNGVRFLNYLLQKSYFPSHGHPVSLRAPPTKEGTRQQPPKKRPLNERQKVCRRIDASRDSLFNRSSALPGLGIRLLYLTRLNRKPENEGVLLQIAVKLGFTVHAMDIGAVSSREKLYWTRWAEVIIGTHGMQLSYVVHTKPTFRGSYDLPENRIVPSLLRSDAVADRSLAEIIMEEDAELSVAMQPCRTYIELMHYVWPEWILFYVELAQLAGVAFERAVPNHVSFGAHVQNPAKEQKLLMTPKVFYWKLPGFQDQRVTYDLVKVQEILEGAIRRWNVCCRTA